jgi:hypothetical protein
VIGTRVAVLAVALGVGIAAPVLAGCGGGGSNDTSSTTTSTTTTTESTTSATDWANGFCGAFKDWANALKPIGQSLQSNPTKANLQSAGDDIKSANETLADDLKGLGRPDVSGADEVKNVVNQLADEIRSDSDKITSALSDVSTATELVTAASAVSTTLLTMQSQIQNSVSQLKSINDSRGSLRDAINNASTCKALQSS